MMSRALLALALFAACSPEFEDGDEHFYITHKDASMPVWVTGNWKSDRKRLVIFEDSGHNPWAEEQDKFYDEVSGFLAEVWP